MTMYTTVATLVILILAPGIMILWWLVRDNRQKQVDSLMALLEQQSAMLDELHTRVDQIPNPIRDRAGVVKGDVLTALIQPRLHGGGSYGEILADYLESISDPVMLNELGHVAKWGGKQKLHTIEHFRVTKKLRRDYAKGRVLPHWFAALCVEDIVADDSEELHNIPWEEMKEEKSKMLH
ncbi:hypothetical protein J2T60_001226 [Natronospira proteinivora]|uniref:Uncharacterized protein n=1 Tax=Natronospira proteinivora TaxID=1807133 RepID=A0ABT1G7Q3_9GAMM|nr:hypothetical protein [Natronospira proteinivora]MCP1727261.1 hypothetical protein [Natronospira proteinivora]